MNIHQTAHLTPSGRERLVRLAQSGLSPKAVAETMGVCLKTVGKWVARLRPKEPPGCRIAPRGLTRCTARPQSQHRDEAVGDVVAKALAIGGAIREVEGAQARGAQSGGDGGRFVMMGWTPPDGIDVPGWWC